MSRIPLKYHTNVLLYTKYTHPTLICRGTDARMHARTDGRMDGRMDGRTENIYSIFRDKLLLLGEHIYTCCACAGGTFFPVVLLCQFFVLAGNRFWFYILTYVT
jgi:hypothetical protein